MGATCSTTQVISGDSCGALVTRCGITSSQFYEYNPQPNLCSTLAVGQYICCSAGSLPNLAPPPNEDGSCATYLVKKGDNCNQIASAHTPLTANQIEQYNEDTWGWVGCAGLQADQNICLSTGTPPFPAPVDGTICGPQVPNTVQPTDGTNWASLNPCPLNACCNIWGQCGTFPEFCTITNSSTGNPGTAAPHTNGCISNCGVDVVYSPTPPAEFRSVGYFEAFNSERPCLNMDVSQIDQSLYTHVHYGFGDITPDFNITGGDYNDQFTKFLKLDRVKRIVSFGGWDFSTNPSTYMIFREAVKPTNRALFALNIVQFLNDNSLDGIDFDWEYPGEPDIGGIPPGSPDEGINYLKFLTVLRSILPAGKTISVATPASYWYLKGFPIKQIASVVDYLVYMTYDLQGVWGEGKLNPQDGCPAGNCLRSNINITETTYALSMLTKAGVPSNRIVIGTTSYGRSFTMSTPGCTGPMCTFIGAGVAGPCTGTAGYMANAEINQILATNPTAQKLMDDASNTDILVYNKTQWVGYMSAEARGNRGALYKFLNFGGTVQWAIDLESFQPPLSITTSSAATVTTTPPNTEPVTTATTTPVATTL